MKPCARQLCIAFVFLIFAGCWSRPAVVTHQRMASAPIIQGNLDKDAAVLGEADEIDQAVMGTPAQPAVNASTGKQRAAVAAAPASAVKAVLDERDATIKTLTASVDSLRVENAKLKAKETTQQQWACRIFGFVCILAAGARLYFGGITPASIKLAGVFLVLGLCSLALAQVLGAWWFLPAVGVLVTLVCVAAGVWLYEHRNDKNLAEELAAKAELAQSTLGKIVPTLDHVSEEVQAGAITDAKAVFAKVYAMLSDARAGMTKEEKAQIHTTRAAVKAAA